MPLSQIGRDRSRSTPWPACGQTESAGNAGTTKGEAGGGQAAGKAGKVMFSGEDGGVASNRLAARRAAKANRPAAQPAPAKEEKKAGGGTDWSAFEGKGHSLRD